MDAYSGFAGVYDLLMDDFDYPSWAEYYLQLISRNGVYPKTLCDCASGTGSMAIEFAKKGIRVTGVDISREMLEHAMEKSRKNGVQIQYVCQNMCMLQLPRPVDALVCACDGVNYLTTDKQLSAFFRCAHAQIRPGGVLAFDISSPYKLKTVLGNEFFGEERDEAAYLWQNTVEGDLVKMDITFFIREADGRYRRVCEKHVQRAHEPDNLVNMLENAGFRNVCVYGDRTPEAPKDNELRIHFSAVRE